MPSNDEVINLLHSLSEKFDEHSKASQLREQRTLQRIDSFERDVRKRLEDAARIAQRALDTATDAHETARHAKHAAGQASISAEGNDHTIFAELGSMKVVMNDVVAKVEKSTEAIERTQGQLADHADKLKEHDDARKTERRKDLISRRTWRAAQTALIPLAVAAMNRLTFILAPPTPKPVEAAQMMAPSLEPPVKVAEPMTVPVAVKATVDAGGK